MRRSLSAELLREAVAAGRIPGAVAAVSDERRVLFEVACGSAGNGSALRTDSVFRIASMTKLVTSVAMMRLVERGRLSLRDPLGRHLPGYRQPPVLAACDPESGEYTTRPAAREATIAQLLAHTSGYGYWFLSAQLRAVAGENASYLQAPFLLHEPGERFTYGIGTDVAGQLIAPVSGQRLEDFFAAEIFGPLAMHTAGYQFPDNDTLVAIQERTAAGWHARPREAPMTEPRGGGGLMMTIADYLALLRLLLNRGRADAGQLLSPESVARIVTNAIGDMMADPPCTVAPARSNDFVYMNGTQKFGLGVMVETRPTPAGRSAGSYAWGGICNTYFWVDPEARIAAALFLQMSPFADNDCVALLRQFETIVYEHLG